MGSGKRPTGSPLPPIADKDEEEEEEGMEVTSGARVAPGCNVVESSPILSVENDEGEVLSPDMGGDEDYAIATHFVKVRRSGTLADVNTLWDLVGTEAVSGSVEAILDHKPGFDRLPSINAFDKVHNSLGPRPNQDTHWMKGLGTRLGIRNIVGRIQFRSSMILFENMTLLQDKRNFKVTTKSCTRLIRCGVTLQKLPNLPHASRIDFL